jgi:predicted TIM-barrel fold metal-dependent hydrolase
MQTPWGEVEVWDAHVHYFSRPLFQALGAASGRTPETIGQTLGWDVPATIDAGLADRWVQELDRHGVAGACCIASVPGDESSVIAAVERHPGRLSGYFMLNPVAPDALDRTRAALDSGRISAICLFPAMQCYSIQDPRLQPIFELAGAKPGVSVFVHCGVLTVGVRKKLGLPSPFDMRFSNPIDLHAVALRFPSLKFIVPHFGAGYFREALILADLCPNVYLDTSSTNSWVKYQPSEMDLRGVFKRSLEVLGAGRLLFGTDSSFFPRGWHRAIFDQQVELLGSLGVSAEDARRIFGGNLKQILGRS